MNREPPVPTAVLREGGVYLITGGAGGIGAQFAEFLARHARAKLALAGRTRSNERVERVAARVRGAGGDAVYMQADVTDGSQVHALIAGVKRRFGALHGVIHAAGVHRDALLAKKSRADMQAVLLPKVAGAIHLDEQTQHEALDFFVLFSSIAAVLGNVGQADYAFANAFLDRFAEQRERLREAGQRTGKTLALNWPFWRDGGMGLDERSEAYMREVMGLWPLSTATGLAAFSAGLASGLSQLLVVEGARPKMARTLGLDAPPEAVASPGGPAAVTAGAPDVQARAEELVRRLLASELKLPLEALDPGEPLERYGVDSMAIVNLNLVLQQQFGELSRTLLFEHRSARELAQYFARHHAAQVEALTGGVQAGAGAATAAQATAAPPRPGLAPVQAGPAARAVDGLAGALGEIAIVGVSGRYPMADDLWQFWDNLTSGRNCITEIPLSRWEHQLDFDPDKNAEGRSYSKWGGFLSDVDKFDAAFFSISAREAEGMDPQERLFLETVWSLFEDAGYTRQTLAPLAPRTGVFVGVMYGHYGWLGLEAALRGHSSRAHSAYWSIANRVSYYFDLQGPSVAIDTACSSSLTSIHLACQALRAGDCQLAIAGGVNLSLHPHKYVQMSQGRYASSDGLCRSFGAGGDGYVAGEGCGALLLKPLQQALEAGDRVYGLVKGSAVNHGGKTNGFTVPSPVAQTLVIRDALRRAELRAEQIGYVEAHGTGTSLGDPIEIAGLTRALAADGAEPLRCPIGSVKSNIGHLESAAGVAGVTKVLLQLRYGQLVPSLHASPPNPNIRFAETPLYVQQQLEPWERTPSQPRRAAVSSFGAGGSNAHVILEEWLDRDADRPRAQGPWLFPLSAKAPDRLQALARALKSFVEQRLEQDAAPLEDVAFTLQVGREPMEERLAIIAASGAELIAALDRYVRGGTGPSLYSGTAKPSGRGAALFGADDDERALLRSWAENGKLAKLAARWVEGVSIEWRLLPSSRTARRVALPTYPFARERHWVARAGTTGGVIGRHALLGRLDPAASVGTGLVFSQRLSDGAWVVAEHRVRGQPMLPGVAYLEMACVAAEHVLGEGSYQLEDVLWLKPLLVAQGGQEVRLVLKELESERLSFEVQTEASGQWSTHARGELARATAQERDPGVDVASLRETLPHHEHGEQLYARYTRAGIEYGEGFRTVQELWSDGRGQVLARLQASPAQRQGWEVWRLAPAMLDGALQSVAGLWEVGDRPMLLPFSVERVRIHAAVPSRGYVHVSGLGGDRYDVSLLDDAGALCVELCELSLREWKGAEAGLLYVPRWEREQAASWETGWERAGAGAQVAVVYAESTGLERALGTSHASEGVQLVRLGERTAREADGRWTWRSDDAQGLAAWLHELPGLKRVYFLGGVDGEEAREESSLVSSQERGVLSLFRLVKGLSHSGRSHGGLELRVVTVSAQRVWDAERVRPWGGSLLGLSKSVGKEYPGLHVSCVDVSGEELRRGELAPLARALVSEPPHGPGKDVALRGGRRYERRLFPVSGLHSGADALKRGGTYLLVGGAGGIGLEVAKWLCTAYAARVVLLGRRELAGELRSRVESSSAGGGECLYVRCDVTRAEEVGAAVRAARARYGKIDGVFHMALVLEDRSIERMDESAFRAALEPKVLGAVRVHEALRDQPPELVVFFSSAQSFWANAGQSNYASGCSFQDAYGHSLEGAHGARVRILNWGYWGSVGVVANEGYRQRLGAQGILPIEVDEGLAALKQVLCGGASQVLAFKGTRAALEKLGVDYGKHVEVYAPDVLGEIAPVAEAGAVAREVGRLGDVERSYRDVEQWGRELLGAVLGTMGALGEVGSSWRAPARAHEVGVVEAHARHWQALLGVLERAGCVRQQDGLVSVLPEAEPRASLAMLEQREQQLRTQYPELVPLLELVGTCVRAYPALLTGRLDALSVLFPQGSMALVERIYKGNAIADFYNHLVARAVLAHVRARLQIDPRAQIRILEVGAGTGGTSESLLAALSEHAASVRYLYTDVSAGFVQHGVRTYVPRHPFVQAQTLDVEQLPATQGIEPGSIDIVVATNVLHATRRMHRTLRNVQWMLRAGGALVINEVTRVFDFSTLIFGLTPGWWLFEDEQERLPDSPLLGRQRWTQLLHESGYERVRFASPHELSGQDVIVAQSSGHVLSEPAVRVARPVEAASRAQAAARPRARQSTAKQPKTISGSSLAERAVAYTKAIFASVLKTDPSRLDAGANFDAYGIDSLISTDIRRKFEQDFGALPATLLFEHTTIAMMSTYLVQEHGARLRALLGEAAPSAVEGRETPAPDESHLEPAPHVRERALPTPAPAGAPFRATDLLLMRSYIDNLGGAQLDEALENLIEDMRRAGAAPV